jgi:peptidoglycan hydrolase-like protein with peptidoglycan-binding domain
MKSAVLAVALLFAALVSAHADPQVAKAQQALKDQGFYYGAVTGTKDTDTTAAIRRYQIRNGLTITGELNAETRKSLGLAAGAPAPSAAPPTRATPQLLRHRRSAARLHLRKILLICAMTMWRNRSTMRSRSAKNAPNAFLSSPSRDLATLQVHADCTRTRAAFSKERRTR